MSPAPAEHEATAADCSDLVTKRLAAMTASADFTLRSSDGKDHRVHLIKLVEQSSVLRSMLLSKVSTAELKLRESAADVQLLVAGMYGAVQPLTWDNIGPLMELATEYDVRDITRNCSLSLQATPLTAEFAPRVLRLTAACGLDDLVAKCQEAIAAGDMFEQLRRKHGDDWCYDLPAPVVAAMSYRQIGTLQTVSKKRIVKRHPGSAHGISKTAVEAAEKHGLRMGVLMGTIFPMILSC